MLQDESFGALKDVLESIEDSIHKNPYGKGWSGRLYGYAPVQGEGFVDGRPWYFRARWASWSFSIAENPENSPLDVRWGKASGWYYESDYGEQTMEASWMPYKDACEIIENCIKEYRQGKGYFTPL